MGPNFFSNSNYTPNSYSGTSYGTSGGSFGQRLKNLSKNTKILIIVAIAAVILISLFAIIGSTRRSAKSETAELVEFYDNTQELWIEWDDFIAEYEKLVNSKLPVDFKEGDYLPFFSLVDLESQAKHIEALFLKSLDADYNNIGLSKNQLENATKAKEVLKSHLPDILRNIDVIQKFENAFTKELMIQLLSENSECKKNEYAEQLLVSEDVETRSAAKNLYDAYCGIIEKHNSGYADDGLFDDTVNDKVKNGISYLNKTLIIVNLDELKPLNKYLSAIHDERERHEN